MGMDRAYSARSRRTARNRSLLILIGVLVFSGMFAQISMLARISSQTKRASMIEKEIGELSARAENLELSINQHHDLKAIEVQAMQMGMEQPKDTQIRVVSLAHSYAGNTSTQTAEFFDGEKVQY